MADRENIGLILVCLLIVAAFGATGLLVLQPAWTRSAAPPPAPPTPVLPNFPAGGSSGTRWNMPDSFQRLTEAIDADPQDIDSYVERARLYHRFGDVASALADLESALDVDPQDASALAARIDINQRQGDEEAVIADLDTLIEIQPGRADLLHQRAWARVRDDDPAGAVKDFTSALELRPGDRIHLEGRAWARLLDGDHAGAIADYDPLIAQGGHNPELLRNRGFCRLWTGEHEQALHDFDQAIARGLDDASLRADRARALLSLGELEKALADADRSVAMRHPDQVRGLRVRAEVYMAMGRYDDALADADRALAASFREGHLHRLRAWVNWARGDLLAARVDAQKAAEIDPGDGRAALLRGIFSCHEGSWEDAERHLVRAAGTQGDAAPRAALYLFLARSAAGDAAAAREKLAAFAADRAAPPQDDWAAPVIDFMLGRIDEEALLAGAEASAKSPRPAAACFYAGSLRLLAGDDAGARVLFERAVATEDHRAHEYHSARAELKKLERAAEEED